MHQYVLNHIQALEELCKKYEVKSMHVFGSILLPSFGESSDIDILISFLDIPVERYTNNYFNLHYALEALFNRKVDLITQNSLSNPFFIESIEETKELVYAA